MLSLDKQMGRWMVNSSVWHHITHDRDEVIQLGNSFICFYCGMALDMGDKWGTKNVYSDLMPFRPAQTCALN